MAKMVVLEKIDSTNKYLKNHYAEYDDGTVVLAKEQTAGAGRSDHIWLSEPFQNITLSILLKHKVDATLTQFIGYLLLVLLKDYGIKALIKWPNDLIIDDCKIGGILVESVIDGDDYNIIIGIGLNVNQTDFGTLNGKATSIRNIAGLTCDIYEVAETLITLYEHFIGKYLEGDKTYLRVISNHSYLQDQEISFNYHGATMTGIVVALDDDGCLVVQTETELLALNSGEVNLVRKK